MSSSVYEAWDQFREADKNALLLNKLRDFFNTHLRNNNLHKHVSLSVCVTLRTLHVTSPR